MARVRQRAAGARGGAGDRHDRSAGGCASSPDAGAVLYLPLTLDIENTTVHGAVARARAADRQRLQRAAAGVLHRRSSTRWPTRRRSTRARRCSELDVRFVVSPEPIARRRSARLAVRRARVRRRDDLRGGVDRGERGGAGRRRRGGAAAAGSGAVRGRRSRPPTTVQWLTGPLDLPAGTITLSVVAPEPSDAGLEGAAPAWVFEATAETAPWVSRFFEARDRFRTSADRELHAARCTSESCAKAGERSIAPTSSITRRATCASGDSAAAARDATALALPLAAHARDALTALVVRAHAAAAPAARPSRCRSTRRAAT